MSKVTTVSLVRIYADDWDGVYANGKLIIEGHEVRFTDLVEWIQEQGAVEIVDYDCHAADEEWLFARGRLPEDLMRVRLASNE